MQNEKTNPAQRAAALEKYWSQEILAQANGQLFKAAKGVGSTEWHAHDDQDEVFYVLKGQLVIQMRDRNVTLDAGELFVVPRGVEHCPKADEDVHLLVIGRNGDVDERRRQTGLELTIAAINRGLSETVQ